MTARLVTSEYLGLSSDASFPTREPFNHRDQLWRQPPCPEPDAAMHMRVPSEGLRDATLGMEGRLGRKVRNDPYGQLESEDCREGELLVL
jgi:hypothetical protein